MERAKKIWEELGLPALKPEQPWFGYSLGEWSEEFDEAAERAVKGDYFETGKMIAKRRRKDVRDEHRNPRSRGRAEGEEEEIALSYQPQLFWSPTPIVMPGLVPGIHVLERTHGWPGRARP